MLSVDLNDNGADALADALGNLPSLTKLHMAVWRCLGGPRGVMYITGGLDKFKPWHLPNVRELRLQLEYVAPNFHAPKLEEFSCYMECMRPQDIGAILKESLRASPLLRRIKLPLNEFHANYFEADESNERVVTAFCELLGENAFPHLTHLDWMSATGVDANASVIQTLTRSPTPSLRSLCCCAEAEHVAPLLQSHPQLETLRVESCSRDGDPPAKAAAKGKP